MGASRLTALLLLPRLTALLLLLTPCCLHGAPARSPARLPATVAAMPKQGTVVFLGDSITWQNQYTALIEAYFTRRYPTRDLRFVNRGIRGDTAARALSRLDRDVVVHHPKLVLVMLGMNDGGYRPLNRRVLATYVGNMERIVHQLRAKTHATIVLVTTSSVAAESYNLRTYNEMLAAMARALVELGHRLRVPVVNLFPPFRSAMARAPNLHPPVQLMQDAVHPGPAGQLLIAEYLLRQLDPRGLKPLAVHADAARARRGIPIQVGAIYVPPSATGAWRLLAARRYFNGHLLYVTGLSHPVRLSADGQVLGRYSARSLAQGIDLATLPRAPWMRSAAKLHRLLQQRWHLRYLLWNPDGRGRKGSRQAPAWLPNVTADQARQRLDDIERQLRLLRQSAALLRVS